jgi:hypothetical protein
VPTELEQRIAARTDEDLYEMLYVHRDDWTPEARAIAETEWSRRSLTPDRFAVVQAVGAERKRAREAINDEPLSTGPRILFFIFNFAFFLGLPQLLIADSLYRGSGYDRKFWDCVKCMAYGLLSLLAASVPQTFEFFARRDDSVGVQALAAAGAQGRREK